jgi:myo-inositol-1-phosphate synthase
LIGSFFGVSGNENNVDKEKMTQDVNQLYSALPEGLQEKVTQCYRNLPQDVKEEVNGRFVGLPEKILGNQSQTTQSTQAQEEVKIEEVPIIKESQNVSKPEEQVPVIQEIEKEKIVEVIAEIKKEYSPEVREKAQKLREIFEDAKLENLLEFVSQTPKLSLEELVESYLSAL